MNLDPPARLLLERRLYEEIVDHLAAAKPAEGVGLLGGLAQGGLRRGTRFFPGTNLDRSPTRYTMDPVEVILALGEMEAQGWDLVAIVHSHPRSAPQPSATDLREAHYPDALLLILGLAGSPPTARCWLLSPPERTGRMGRATFREVPVVVDDPGREGQRGAHGPVEMR